MTVTKRLTLEWIVLQIGPKSTDRSKVYIVITLYSTILGLMSSGVDYVISFSCL